MGGSRRCRACLVQPILALPALPLHLRLLRAACRGLLQRCLGFGQKARGLLLPLPLVLLRKRHRAHGRQLRRRHCSCALWLRHAQQRRHRLLWLLLWLLRLRLLQRQRLVGEVARQSSSTRKLCGRPCRRRRLHGAWCCRCHAARLFRRPAQRLQAQRVALYGHWRNGRVVLWRVGHLQSPTGRSFRAEQQRMAPLPVKQRKCKATQPPPTHIVHARQRVHHGRRFQRRAAGGPWRSCWEVRGRQAGRDQAGRGAGSVPAVASCWAAISPPAGASRSSSELLSSSEAPPRLAQISQYRFCMCTREAGLVQGQPQRRRGERQGNRRRRRLAAAGGGCRLRLAAARLPADAGHPQGSGHGRLHLQLWARCLAAAAPPLHCAACALLSLYRTSGWSVRQNAKQGLLEPPSCAESKV